MDCRIEQKPAFNVVGIKERISTIDGENFKRIPQFWEESAANGMVDQIAKMSIGEPWGALGVCADMYDDSSFDYYIAATTDAPPPDGMSKIAIPAATWAIFESIGPIPSALQDLWKRIYNEWFPTSGYEHAAIPEFEVYSMGDMSSRTYKCEVWIPVTKNK